MSASSQGRELVNAAQHAWYRYGALRELYQCQTEEERAERQRAGDAAMKAETALLDYIESLETGDAPARVIREWTPSPTTKLSTLAAERDARLAAAPMPEAKAS
jgi:hypothetical protein